jgi:hypothetical protein
MEGPISVKQKVKVQGKWGKKKFPRAGALLVLAVVREA